MKNKIVDRIKPLVISESEVNTNNAWGFGGAIKTVYLLSAKVNDIPLSLHVGTACYRHLPSERFINLRLNGSIVAEGNNEILKYLKDNNI